ncbi:LRP4 [Mytilus coruscus]|uniref:LRP4 n=1 Tax=Mytilus coruscus TaxID=42192 RepID=A0A6J8BK63_MYTCO|nr:LRP4 [Mytilus coruscus]
MELDVDTRNVTVLFRDVGSNVFSLDYDYENRYVYFPRYSLRDILRFSYPSQNITLQHVVNTSSFPSGVAVDSANDHVYWVNDNRGTLSRCKSDGTNIVVLLTSLSDTFMIRLDLTNRWMYIGYYSKGISKSRFDLSDISMIANITSGFVDCMDLEIESVVFVSIFNMADAKADPKSSSKSYAEAASCGDQSSNDQSCPNDCRTCDGSGHKASYCTTWPNDWVCQTCRKSGHTAKYCNADSDSSSEDSHSESESDSDISSHPVKMKSQKQTKQLMQKIKHRHLSSPSISSQVMM